MSHKSCENLQMSCVMEASQLIKRASGPAEVGGGIKAAIGRAARRLGWEFSRARNIWYGRARRIEAMEMDQLRELSRQQAARYERIANAMGEVDSDFYGQEINALVDMARALRNTNLS